MRRRRAVSEALAVIPENEPYAILATGGYIGEGFDLARPDTLFLAMPVSWRGTLAHYLGRVTRRRPDKREVRVYDYADLQVPALARMYRKRIKGYGSLGWSVQPHS
ncbi:MAG TPA: hypothetical protein VNL71_10985 [Chloroflexota bacterium]|nr:hypothetical protein [Chloroflexota bacterium]